MGAKNLLVLTLYPQVKLTEYVQLLGGNTQGNLTEDATHLIASEPGSKKYCCALKLGLPIMNPEWIKELRARYTEAIDYDFDGVSEQHSSSGLV